MPPDLPNEQELTLKKRARRRLVGAIALVLLMVIILPQVLQDRALLAQQEPIKITMPMDTSPLNQQPVSQDVADVKALNSDESVSDDKVPDFIEPVTEPVVVKQIENKPVKETQINTAIAPQPEKKVAVKTPDAGKAQTQAAIKPQESFTVQVGVYSDVDNVKRLQEQLKQAGFSTHTEKVKTPKGDSLRLKAGNFNSREDAVAALAKIKAIGLSGIVIGNE
ncbi:MAG TPA: SPOR domain-containing protein [Methylotenera sp.]